MLQLFTYSVRVVSDAWKVAVMKLIQRERGVALFRRAMQLVALPELAATQTNIHTL